MSGLETGQSFEERGGVVYVSCDTAPQSLEELVDAIRLDRLLGQNLNDLDLEDALAFVDLVESTGEGDEIVRSLPFIDLPGATGVELRLPTDDSSE